MTVGQKRAPRLLAGIRRGYTSPRWMAAGIRHLSENSTRYDAGSLASVSGIDVKTGKTSEHSPPSCQIKPENAPCNEADHDHLSHKKLVEAVHDIWITHKKYSKEIFDLIISPNNLAQA